MVKNRSAPGTEVTAYVLVAVDDVDKHCEHTRQCRANIVHPPSDMPFGERILPGIMQALVDVLAACRRCSTRGMGCEISRR